MSMQDPISDLLTQIRNGQSAGKTQVELPSSKIKVAILKVLAEEGFIEGYSVKEGAKGKTRVAVELKYHDRNGIKEPVIAKIKRASRPGLRAYYEAVNVPKILGGLGLGVVSTPKGVVSDYKARSMGVGGELLCTVE